MDTTDVMNRQAQKAIKYGLRYGMSGKSNFMRTLIEEQVEMVRAMSVARNTGVGYICLEHLDFEDLERQMIRQVHDEQQIEVGTSTQPERWFTRNQRGRHWDKQRLQPVVQKKQDPLEAMAFALHEQFMVERFGPYQNPVHKMGYVLEAPHRQTIYCKMVKRGGKISTQELTNRWFSDETYNTMFNKGE